jgi:hypothetical protein
MYSPLQLLHARGSAGEPLPTVWPALARNGIVHRRGQLCLVVAAPSVGKSAFALTYALRAKVPTLYFSADSDEATQLARCASILMGWTMARSMSAVLSGKMNGATPVLLDQMIKFNVDAEPTIDSFESSLKAFDAKYEDYPALIIVDNVTDMVTSASVDDPFAGLEALTNYLHGKSRETGAHVIGLHHVQGQYNNGNIPVPLGGIKQQIGRVPELILALHKGSAYPCDVLNVAAIKNRAAMFDSSGQTFVSLAFDGDTMSIKDSA